MAVFSGTLVECMRQFAPQTRGPLRDALLLVLDISRKTLPDWFRDTTPKMFGINRLTLEVVLGLLDYDVVDRQRDPRLWSLGEPLAYRIVGARDLQVEIGYARRPDADSLLSLLRRSAPKLSAERIKLIDAAIAKHAAATQAAKRDWLQLLHEVHPSEGTKPDQTLVADATSAVAVVRSPTSVGVAERDRGATMISPLGVVAERRHGAADAQMRKAMVSFVAGQIMALRPMVEHVLGPGYTPTDRQLLRDSANGVKFNAVFELSTLLNRLCGETANHFYGGKES